MALSARTRRPSLNSEVIAPGQAPSHRIARLLMAWWLRLARGHVLPATLRAQLALAGGERALLAGRDPAGDYTLVATDRALHHRTGSDSWACLGWEQITAVGWEETADCLVVTGVAGVAPRRTTVPLRRRGPWLELAEERITHTRLCRQHIPVGRHEHVAVEVRCCPATGELRWILVSHGGLDADDQDLDNRIERAVTRLCADLGIPPAPSYLRIRSGPGSEADGRNTGLPV